MNKIECITEHIRNFWSNEDIIRAWNNYCSEECMEDYIHSNDEYFFEEMFEKADDAVRAVCYGEYHYQDEYVVFNAYGNLDSFDYWKDENSPIDLDILAEYLVDNGDSDTPGIEDLDSDFIEKFAEENNVDINEVEEIVNNYLEEEDFDFLTEDWEDLAEIVKERLD